MKIILSLLLSLFCTAAYAQVPTELCTPVTTNGKTTCQIAGTAANPFYISGTVSSGVTLGTSATATNPSKSGDLTTGLFSDGVGLVETSSSGVKEMTIGTSGILMAPNVAIGTSATPVFTLQVQGNGTYTSTTGTGGLALKNATVPTKELYMGYDSALGTNGSGYIQAINVGIANTNLLIEPSGGHVLIGTTTDTQVLSVEGNIFAHGGLQIENGAGTGFWINPLSGGNNMAIGGVGGSAPSLGAINIYQGGNVTVGPTTSGSSLFNVYGGVGIGTSYISNTAPTNGMIVQGAVGIGTATPTTGAALDLKYNTNSMLLPVGTTTQRPSTGVNGMIRYNSTANLIEAYVNGVWSSIASGSGGTPTCGTGCSSITSSPQSTDVRGSMTVTALATSAVVNFSTTLPSAPFCTCSGSLSTSVVSCTNTTSAITANLSVGVTGDVITWQCPQ